MWITEPFSGPLWTECEQRVVPDCPFGASDRIGCADCVALLQPVCEHVQTTPQ